jgi:lipopolysaccharide export system permease protein
MIRLERYLAATVLGAIGLVMSVLLVLGLLFTFIDEQGSVGVGHYGMAEALFYSLLNVPRFVLQALPAGTLIGGMLGIGLLARWHELTAMRTAGMSRWRLAGAMAGCGALLALGGLVVGETFAPQLEQMADERKALARFENFSLAGAGGAWVRDGDLIINIAERSRDRQYSGMSVFRLDADDRIRAIGHAERAVRGIGSSWQLGDYSETRFGSAQLESQRVVTQQLDSAASVGFLQLAVIEPTEMALGALHASIGYLSANDQDTRAYRLAFWSGIARYVAVPLALLFALPFGFGSMRSAGSGARTSIGLGVGLLYFFVQRTVDSGAVVYNLDPMLLAWVPTLLMGAVAGVLIWRTR